MASNTEEIIKFIKINNLTPISLLEAISKRANIAVAHGTDSKTLKLALITMLAKYVDSVNHTTDDPLIGSISFIKTESGVECYIGSELICTIGESSSITIDTELDKDSENAIANSAVAEALEDLAGNIPTVDTELDKTSDNAISNKAVAEALENVKPSGDITIGFGLRKNEDGSIETTDESRINRVDTSAWTGSMAVSNPINNALNDYGNIPLSVTQLTLNIDNTHTEYLLEVGLQLSIPEGHPGLLLNINTINPQELYFSGYPEQFLEGTTYQMTILDNCVTVAEYRKLES